MKKLKNTKSFLFLLILNFLIISFLIYRLPLNPISYNDMSRLAGTIAIARYNKFYIDDTVFVVTGDKVFYNNHYYSSKPPVLHTLLGYITHSFFKLKPQLLANDNAIYKFITFLSVVLPLILIFNVFFILLFFNFKLNYKYSLFFSIFLVVGTLLFTFSRYLNNHVLESFLSLLFVYVYFNKNRLSLNFYYPLIGFILSLIFVIDITFGAVFLPMVFWLIFHKNNFSLKNILLIFLGLSPLVFFHFYLWYSQLNTFLPPQLFPYKYLNYPGSPWVGINQSVKSLNHPFLLRLFNYTFGTHGLFLYQPILIFPYIYLKKIPKKYREYFIFTVFITLGYIFLNAMLQPDYFGSAFGPRRFLPLIILNMVLLTTLFKNFLRKSNKPFILLTCLTIIISLLGYLNPWNNYASNLPIFGNTLFPLVYTFYITLF